VRSKSFPEYQFNILEKNEPVGAAGAQDILDGLLDLRIRAVQLRHADRSLRTMTQSTPSQYAVIS
jgi:hypothetical protein